MSQRHSRHLRIRKKVSGTTSTPRLTVFRSNKFTYAQLIDDTKAMTIVSISDLKLTGKTKVEKAKIAGASLAKLAKAKKIEKIVFDRSGYKYHGRVKAFAEGLREGGLIF